MYYHNLQYPYNIYQQPPSTAPPPTLAAPPVHFGAGAAGALMPPLPPLVPPHDHACRRRRTAASGKCKASKKNKKGTSRRNTRDDTRRDYYNYYVQQHQQQQLQYMQAYIQSLLSYMATPQCPATAANNRVIINAGDAGGTAGGGGGDGAQNKNGGGGGGMGLGSMSRENKNYIVAWARDNADKWLGPISPEALDFYTVDKVAMHKFEVFLRNGGTHVLEQASRYLGRRFATPRELVFAVTNMIHSEGPNYVNQLMDYLGCDFSYYLDPEDENGILAQAGKREWRRAYYNERGHRPTLREEQERDAVLKYTSLAGGGHSVGVLDRFGNPPRSIGNGGGNKLSSSSSSSQPSNEGQKLVTVTSGQNKIQISVPSKRVQQQQHNNKVVLPRTISAAPPGFAVHRGMPPPPPVSGQPPQPIAMVPRQPLLPVKPMGNALGGDSIFPEATQNVFSLSLGKPGSLLYPSDEE